MKVHYPDKPIVNSCSRGPIFELNVQCYRICQFNLLDVKQEEISLANVEELLKDFDWKEAGNAAALEERLLDELAALESVSLNQRLVLARRVTS